MAKSQLQVTTILMLSHEEAHWLKALVQNPIDVAAPDDEDPGCREIRSSIFNALNNPEHARF